MENRLYILDLVEQRLVLSCKGKRVLHSSSGGNYHLLVTASVPDPLPYDPLATIIQSQLPLCHLSRGLVRQCQLRLTSCWKRVATSGLT
jgi:hypothetical protein